MRSRKICAAAAAFSAAVCIALAACGDEHPAPVSSVVTGSAVQAESPKTTVTSASKTETETAKTAENSVTTAPTGTLAETVSSAPEPKAEYEKTVPPDYLYGEGEVRLYNTAPISDAYKSGDRAGLDEIQTAILDKAEQILSEIVTEDMSEYDKERAVHDYIVRSCTYDKAALSVLKTPSEHSDDPYGALVNGSAICTGYTLSFRLLMEMLDIPCETVYCIKSLTSQHAWSIVTIDGAKYYVDITWDDPIPDKEGRISHHENFNVSRRFMALDHKLPDDCPDTTEFKDTCASHELAPEPQNEEELTALIRDAAARDTNLIFFIPSEGGLWDNGIDREDGKSPDFDDLELEKMARKSCRAAGFEFYNLHIYETDKGEAVGIRFYQKK